MGKFGSGPKGSSDGYSSHKCNNYFKEDDKLSLDREDWERFRWYSERYNNHHRSQAIERKILESAKEARAMMQEQTSITWSATAFFEDALMQLITNRSSLMNSYVFGFFRPIRRPEINKQLFEHRQNELERHTEQLAKWFDHKMEPEEAAKAFVESRLRIVNDTKLCAASNKALLDVAANALEPERRPSGGLRNSRDTVWGRSEVIVLRFGEKLTFFFVVFLSKQGKTHGKKPKPGAPKEPPNFWNTNPNEVRPELTREQLDEAAERRAEALREEQRREVARREAEEARRKEQEELDRVLKESMKNAENDEDELLRRALEMSKAETKAASARPKTQEELDMEEAIRLSLMDR
jgi:hypothetical protein